jgi:Trk-type K+ transport systems, membrane components
MGTLAFFVAEYNNLMSEMGLKERLLSSYFQSVTTRTAGFNTIDTSQLSKASAFTSVLLMYVGASPGSTGGGVKTTTFMIILISVFSMMRGDRDVNVFSRKVSVNIIKRVMALIALSVGLLALMIYLLLLIEPFPFEQIVFEATSAFGTVGLSMGITPLLSKASQIIIIILMYLGRVGPLTLIFSLSEHLGKANFIYTEERIIIG